MKKAILVSICVLTIAFLAQPCPAQRPQVTLETNFGDIVIELFDANAPITVANFLAYVNSGFYDGLIFHRVIPDFMIQGGGFDPNLTRMPTADPIILESDNGLLNIRGTVAMARTSAPNSATSGFFINQDPNNSRSYLNYNEPNQVYGYCVFGRVISDMNVVDAIAAIETEDYAGPTNDMNDVPTGPNSPVMIYKASERVGVLGDIDENFGVDFGDFTTMASNWRSGQTEQLFYENIVVSDKSDIDGDTYVWESLSHNIYGYDLSASNQFTICAGSDDQRSPAISGQTVVWYDDRRGGYDDIYGYNMATDSEFVISDVNYPQRYPAVSGNIAAWQDYRNYHTDHGQGKMETDIYAADITDPNNPLVFEVYSDIYSQTNPVIDGNIVVWEHDDNEYTHYIIAADITTPNEPNVFAVCVSPGEQYAPKISGNLIIWLRDMYESKAVFCYDLDTESTSYIALGDIDNSDIDDGIVVWQDRRDGNWDIYGYDISSGIEFPVIIADGNQVNPIISGNNVAWRDTDNNPDGLHWRKLCDQYMQGDFNGDCEIDIDDLTTMLSNWLR